MPIDDLTALGDALRAARKEKNLTQEQLADESANFYRAVWKFCT